MKTWFRKIILSVTVLLFLGGSAWAQGRIATFDLRKVFDHYWKRQQAYALLKEDAASIGKDDKNMLDDWNKAKNEYQKLLDQAISAEERDRRAGVRARCAQECRPHKGQCPILSRTSSTLNCGYPS